jgi:hypothetical protein
MRTIGKISFAVALLLSANVAFGQLQIGGIVGIGGATQSTIGNIYENDLAYSFNAGLIIRRPISNAFAIKTNLLYSSKGRTFNVLQSEEFVNRRDRFSYLELPVKMEYSIPINNNRLFVGMGPYAGILLDSNMEIDGISTNINDETKTYDFGMAFELGYCKTILNGELQISFGYDMGFTKIADYDRNLRNKNLVLNIGFLL